MEETLDRDDACLRVGIQRRLAALELARTGPDAPALALHLVLARLDDEAKQIVGVGEGAQLVEADRLVRARPGGDVVADGKIEAAAGDVRWCNRLERIERPEPVGAGAARDAPAGAIGHLDLVRRRRQSRLAGA